MADSGAYRESVPLFQRLRERRRTSRQIALYLIVLAVLALAEPDVATFVVGVLFVIGGLALRAWTFGHLEKNCRLATTGPYAHSRNPAYLGSLVILGGIALAAGNNNNALGIAMWVAGGAGIAVFFLFYLPRKFEREHTRMAEMFPDDAKRHADNVPAFWPRLTPWASGDTQRFSMARLRANHELGWVLICATGLAIMWV